MKKIELTGYGRVFLFIEILILCMANGSVRAQFGLSHPNALSAAQAAQESTSLLVSTSNRHTDPVALEGQTVSGNIFVFTSPDSGVLRVSFYLDDPDRAGQPRQVENNPPYDFAGGTSTIARPFNTFTILDGPHTITAAVELTAGGTEVVHATFIVANSSASLVFNPNSLSFSLPVGGSDSHTIDLSATDGSAVSYTLSNDAGWLAASPEAGTTPGTISIQADAAGLSAGTYSATLTASAPGLASAELEVSLTILNDDPQSPMTVKKWHAATIDFAGPYASELDNSPNPFLDYRLQVTFVSPSGRRFEVPGFFDGDGNGNGAGNVWRVRFTPDETGTWSYLASFRTGSNLAVDLNPNAGSETSFNGSSGTFSVTELDPDAPGFLKFGRLEYTGGYYLKFRDGPFWIKGGTNSPETFVGYAGFDNTPAGPYGLLDFDVHIQDWNTGDPDWGDGKGKGMIGVFNYMEEKHINSVFFLPMNIGGDGQNAWPFAGPIDPAGSNSNDNVHYDISKLYQWNIVFDHAQKTGVLLHFVLNEAESANKNELDNAALGVERKLFYRELIARFGYINALEWNISEEYEIQLPLSPETVKEFAGYIQSVDPYDHPITVHNNTSLVDSWTPFLGDPRFSITSFQLPEDAASYGEEVEQWRAKTGDAGRPLPISLDEIRTSTTNNMDSQRKEVIWKTFLSGGNLEFYIGGPNIDKRLDNFRSYEALWNFSWYARKFLEENLPFWEMEPNDALLTGESTEFGGGQVLAEVGSAYAIYLPRANPSGVLDLRNVQRDFTKRWYNPRNGSFEGPTTSVTGGGMLNIGEPPSDPSEDWALLLIDPNIMNFLPKGILFLPQLMK